MAELEQTLDSTEIADMIDKEHSKLLRDIRRYIEQFNEAEIGFVDFFKESTYKDAKGKTRPCYRITKKGCEFIAHKLTGTKGTIFTARYINRFHEMQDILSKEAAKPELPWFIRRFMGGYIMLFRDFETITGVQLAGNYTSLNRYYHLRPGTDWNGFGWREDKEKFKQDHGFDYGDDDCMKYLYPCGVVKALDIFAKEHRSNTELDSCNMIMDGIKKLRLNTRRLPEIYTKSAGNNLKEEKPVQISIIVNGKAMTV